MTTARTALIRSSSDTGASAVEYAILVSAIAAVLVALIFGLGVLTASEFSGTCTTLVTAANNGGTC